MEYLSIILSGLRQTIALCSVPFPFRMYDRYNVGCSHRYHAHVCLYCGDIG